MSKTISAKELAEHGKDSKQLWVAIEGGVYDVTEFADEHPGGKKILVNSCGVDATEKFWKFHSKKVLNKTAAPMKIGQLAENSKL
ncbi:hypothetical protein OIO90_000498 [Microbotryomycetes sp. JL221]|nr:hypothetical protein OIO90_000498 [Microbotryomycetes sp. JL221]